MNDKLFWAAFNDELAKVAAKVPATKPQIYAEAEAAGRQRAEKMKRMQPPGQTVVPKAVKYPPTLAEKIEKAKKPITSAVKETTVAPPSSFEQAQRALGKGVEAAKEKGSELASKAKVFGTEAFGKTKAFWKGLHPYAKAGIVGGGAGLGLLALMHRRRSKED